MKRTIVFLIALPLFLLAFSFLSPNVVLAADPAITAPSDWLGKIDFKGTPDGVEALMKARSWAEVGTTIVPAIFNMIFFLSLLFCLALIVRAGLMFVLSEGNKENFAKARTALTNALIGLAFVLSVFLIFNLAQLLLGVNLANRPYFGFLGTPCAQTGTCVQPDQLGTQPE